MTITNHHTRAVQRDREQALERQIALTKSQLNDLLKAWHEYEDAFGNVEAPVEGYPFSESLDEVAYAAQAMRLTTKIGA